MFFYFFFPNDDCLLDDTPWVFVSQQENMDKHIIRMLYELIKLCELPSEGPSIE